MDKVLVLGGYGNFGKRIVNLLIKQNIPVIIVGRNEQKLKAFLQTLSSPLVGGVAFDIKKELALQLKRLSPKIVINTCGPFQHTDYSIIETCIERNIHYIDLADGRKYVNGIDTLNDLAKEKNVIVITGASTVPALTSAVIEHYQSEFKALHSLKFGIAPGQKAERGLATTQAILSYVGQKLPPCPGFKTRYGWQDLYRQKYPSIGYRWMANCEIPDLDLLPKKYGIKKIKFSAGIENSFLHLGTWLISWCIRLGLKINLVKHASRLLKISHWFDKWGSQDGGMHIIMQGTDKSDKLIKKSWVIIGLEGDGPYIPCIPSVILAKKILNHEFNTTGSMACVGLISLKEYLEELKHLNIQTYFN